MAGWHRLGGGAACLVVLAGCLGRSQDSSPSDGSTGAQPPPGDETTPPAPPPPPPPPAEIPPVTDGHWSYYGPAQGLSQDVQDVSADEGGNVYVAGGDALYAKGRADVSFLRFDDANAGLTRNCNDFSEIMNPVPTTPFRLCRVLSVAGAAPGKAIIGFDGFGIEAQHGTAWALAAGGADVVAFDPDRKTLSRTRHVFIASPPHRICGVTHEEQATTCSDPNDFWWVNGRRLVHRIRRVVVNHDRSSPLYGDVWLAGEHAAFSALLNDAPARGLVDLTAGLGPEWADAKDVREHLHPAITPPDGQFINGEAWALSIDPRTGTPWGSNGFRTAYVLGYGANLAEDLWWMGPSPRGGPEFLDLWPDPPDTYFGKSDDAVHSMSHCPDGTLWIGSLLHGLARIDPAGAISFLDLPASAGVGNSVSAVACDPTDASLWIGLLYGGVMRLRAGAFERIAPDGAPAFAHHMVQSIQIDAWSSPRVVYFAFVPQTDAAGAILQGGGVGAYDGP
jgi:hypothetical protein